MNLDYERFAAQVETVLADVKRQGENPSNWYNRARTLSDAIRCLFGLHRVAQSGSLTSSFHFVERCSCGAGRMDGRMWHKEKWWVGPRKAKTP